ncbi:unnamed protein product [Allacma fusca]|uniref:Uncharacterized protein n=1 Tax=Allacma fusca TaxID=39272 RepID=A0A8J2LSI1_9HEXA|nr:unnamed protein product [Allacma fusca]
MLVDGKKTETLLHRKGNTKGLKVRSKTYLFEASVLRILCLKLKNTVRVSSHDIKYNTEGILQDDDDDDDKKSLTQSTSIINVPMIEKCYNSSRIQYKMDFA